MLQATCYGLRCYCFIAIHSALSAVSVVIAYYYNLMNMKLCERRIIYCMNGRRIIVIHLHGIVVHTYTVAMYMHTHII